jgi:hypothetical protein
VRKSSVLNDRVELGDLFIGCIYLPALEAGRRFHAVAAAARDR